MVCSIHFVDHRGPKILTITVDIDKIVILLTLKLLKVRNTVRVRIQSPEFKLRNRSS